MNQPIKYSLSSTQFQGEVILEFDQEGFLVRFDSYGAQLSTRQKSWLARELPRHLDDLKQVLGNSSTATLTELKQDITFEMFWDRYDEKIRSSRKKALTRWNNMSKTDKMKAYRSISRYEMNLLPGTAKKYAETYLNAELWNN